MPQNDPKAVSVEKSKNLQLYTSEENTKWFKDEWAEWSEKKRKNNLPYTQNAFLELILSLFMIYKSLPEEFGILKEKYNKKVINEDDTTNNTDIMD